MTGQPQLLLAKVLPGDRAFDGLLTHHCCSIGKTEARFYPQNKGDSASIQRDGAVSDCVIMSE